MLGRFFREGRFGLGSFFRGGKSMLVYFSGGDSIPGRFFRGGGKFYAGENSMLQHRHMFFFYFYLNWIPYKHYIQHVRW